MLNNFSITVRMFLLIILPTIILVAIGFLSFQVITKNTDALKASEMAFESVNAANKVSLNINKHYTQLLSNINSGFIFWKAGEKRTKKGVAAIEKSFIEFNNLLSEKEKENIDIKQIIGQQERLLTSYKKFSSIFSKPEDKVKLNTYVLKKMFPLANALTSSMHQIEASKYAQTEALASSTIAVSEKAVENSFIMILASILVTTVLGYLILISITKPTKKLTEIVKRLAQGEYDVRAQVVGSDEIAKLGTAFNELLDDRENTLSSAETEHQELNQSIFKLLQAVAELSERNLTIRAEVTEDATGPVADAINLLAEETAHTLGQVRDVAQEVHNTSQQVNSHLMSVNKLAMREQEQAIETTDQMEKMLLRLDSIATTADETNDLANNATLTTKKAHASVTGTLDGMAVIRDTVQETGKKIKQLGERSQEISHVIDIINTIAERTTVLALNASMQAVAAGDAGRGFSVIAEEIQRLAESSRDSTSQISTLVRNIQQETNSTIATMDRTIEQVVDGSTRAEDAAQQMKDVLNTTSQLVNSVDQIAIASREQVNISESLKYKAQSILKSTQSTGQELLSLTGLSRNMSDYAQQLVHSVNIFTLDDDKKSDKTA